MAHKEVDLLSFLHEVEGRAPDAVRRDLERDEKIMEASLRLLQREKEREEERAKEEVDFETFLREGGKSTLSDLKAQYEKQDQLVPPHSPLTGSKGARKESKIGGRWKRAPPKIAFVDPKTGVRHMRPTAAAAAAAAADANIEARRSRSKSPELRDGAKSPKPASRKGSKSPPPRKGSKSPPIVS